MFIVKIAFVLIAYFISKCKGKLSCFVVVATLMSTVETILIIQYIYQLAMADNLKDCKKCILGQTVDFDEAPTIEINKEVECRFVLIYFLFTVPLRVGLVLNSLIDKYERKEDTYIEKSIDDAFNLRAQPDIVVKSKKKDITYIADNKNQDLFKSILDSYKQSVQEGRPAGMSGLKLSPKKEGAAMFEKVPELYEKTRNNEFS